MTPSPSILAAELLESRIVEKAAQTGGLFNVLPTVPLLDCFSDPVKGVTPTPQVLLENHCGSNLDLSIFRRQDERLLQQWQGRGGVSESRVVFRQVHQQSRVS